jgi:hypothetical protein
VLQEPVYRARRWALVGAAVLLLGGWGVVSEAIPLEKEKPPTYNSLDRDGFISGCRSEGGSEKGCGCAFDYIEQRVPYSEYQKANRTDNVDDWPPRARRIIADAFTHCPA